MIEIAYYGMTHCGMRRRNNEDAFLLEQQGQCIAAVVADGMGGYEGGEVASYLTCKCIADYLHDMPADASREETLRQAVVYANNAVVEQQQNPRLCHMGCVATATLFDPEQRRAYMCHVGDTRLYRYSGGKLAKLSRDHSQVGALEEAGLLTEHEAMTHARRNIVARHIGNCRLRPDTDYLMSLGFDIEPHTQYLICSDGLYDMIDAAAITEVLAQESTPQEKVKSLILRANRAGGKDNITIIILEARET